MWYNNDAWDGLGVYRSDNCLEWTLQAGNLLQTPGQGTDDQVKSGHPDAVVTGGRAFLFSFTHPGRTRPDVKPKDAKFRRSSIRVVELEFQNGEITCDRNRTAYMLLRSPDPSGD